jgi:hypothetical protein
MSDVKSFLSGLLKRLQEPRSSDPMMLMPTPSEVDQLQRSRRRAEMARELLMNRVFQEAIQFMNEQTVQEIAGADPLDTATLTVLRLKLGVISEFPQALSSFIDEFEMIEAIRHEQERREQLIDEAA